MEKFLKIDFYIQLFAVLICVITLCIFSIIKENSDILALYYLIIGGIQLLSFLIRIYLPYRKNIFFNVYGLSIIPIWLGMLGVFLKIDLLAYLIWFGILGFFYAPFMSIFYIIYCYETSKIYSKPSC